jgi:hypothetical protein
LAELCLQKHNFCLFKFDTELTSILITTFAFKFTGGIR